MAFARKLGIIIDDAVFSAADGVHTARITGSTVSLQMKNVTSLKKIENYWITDTGSPHYVSMADNLKELDVYTRGLAIRNNTLFRKEGINVNFVQQEEGAYFVRTFERGVEDETLACGTGVTAVAIAMAQQKKETGAYITEIRTLGGVLKVSFEKNPDATYTSIYLEGPAELVFEGHIFL